MTENCTPNVGLKNQNLRKKYDRKKPSSLQKIKFQCFVKLDKPIWMRISNFKSSDFFQRFWHVDNVNLTSQEFSDVLILGHFSVQFGTHRTKNPEF